MASINDVNNSINKVNTTIHKEIDATNAVNTSVGNVQTSVDKVAADIVTLDGDLKSGFAQTIQELKNLEALGVATVELLFHLSQQADTMICALKQISQNTCGILNEVTAQTALQKQLTKDSDIIRHIDEAEHPGAALSFHQIEELRKQIEKCCPPPVAVPPCTYQPCPSPPPIKQPQVPTTGTSPQNPR
jgi:hypothetical protein